MNRDEFVKQYSVCMSNMLALAEKARREGLLALEGGIDREKAAEREIFEYGMLFVVDGYDAAIIEKVLGNIISQEKDEYTRILKTIQMEAVLGIQQGYNTRVLYFLLNSLTDIPLKDDDIYAVHVLRLEDRVSETQTFAFKDIVLLDDLAVQRILRETDSNDLAKALKPADGEVQDKVFGNLSKNAVKMLKEDMDYMGQIHPSDVEEAQQKIISIIRRLGETGEIIIGMGEFADEEEDEQDDDGRYDAWS